MNPSTDIWVWISALLTLGCFSFLYRDNPFYKFCEYLFVGLATGYYFAIQWQNTLRPNLVNPLLEGPQGPGYLLHLVPLVLVILMLARLVPGASWVSRWPIAIMVGAFAGLAVIGNAQGDLISQVQANLVPVVDPAALRNLAAAEGGTDRFISFLWVLGNGLMITGLLATLVFFFFSLEHRGAVGKVAAVGVWFLMLSFGASYGFTVMSRISLLLERLRFLYGDWLGFVINR